MPRSLMSILCMGLLDPRTVFSTGTMTLDVERQPQSGGRRLSPTPLGLGLDEALARMETAYSGSGVATGVCAPEALNPENRDRRLWRWPAPMTVCGARRNGPGVAGR